MALTRIKYRTGSTGLAYLRVSTKGQVETEFDPAGMSLPTQSRLCAEKARQKSLTILDELIDPGVSGTSIEKRKSYQELLKRLEADPTISFVMVYSLFRLHRNWPEAGRMVQQLQALGVRLLSVSEEIDDSTAAGRLMLGVMFSVGGYQSEASSEDMREKLRQKALVARY